MSRPGLRLAQRLQVLLRDRMSLRLQLVVLTGVLAGLVAIGLIVVVQIALADASNNASGRVLRDRADALVKGINAASPDRVLRVPRKQLDPGVAVYDEEGAQVAGTVPPSMRVTFDQLSTSATPRMVEGGEHYAVAAVPFTTAGGTHGVVVMTEPKAPYERDERSALIVSVIAGALLVLVGTGSAAWISQRVLRPVEYMARTADDWSEHDLERRFGLGPPTNEIRALGSTLDGLLDKVANVIRSEQRLTSELAHELRTPLTAIQGIAELMGMRGDLDPQTHEDLGMVKNACASMSATITVLLDIARQDSMATLRDRTSMDDLALELEKHSYSGGELEVVFPEKLALDVPRALAVRALLPVIDNAFNVSEHVRVHALHRERHIDVLVSDAGPGIPMESVERVFDPGWSGNGGSGLGLALARRVARSGGGDVILVEAHNKDGGATFAISFPGGMAW